jgi:Flp pilus assembly protein TadG
MNPSKTPRHQRGAVLVTVALMMLALLGFMGIAVDFGRNYIVKSELQTAVDSCALSAAQELDEQATSITRARNAGITAGNLNRVNLQSENWSGQGQLTDASLTFRRADYSETTDPLLAVYVECTHTQPNVENWLMDAWAGSTGRADLFPGTRNIMASAAATRVSAQTTCPIPIALKRAPGTSPPMYGYQVGQWVTVWGRRLAGPGEFGWYNLDGSTNARETKDQLESGRCGMEVGDQLGTPGAKTSVDVVWNYRFGIYRNNGDAAEHRPDLSGYSYRQTNQDGNWINAQPLTLADGSTTYHWGAWSGTPGATAHSSAANFITKRAQFRSFDDTGTDIGRGSTVVFGRANQLNGFQNLATPGAAGEHGTLGANRRIATVPVIDDANRVIDYMCIFMLHPLSGPNDEAQVEIRGNAGTLSSPCTTSGLPGGSAGPLVPALVR